MLTRLLMFSRTQLLVLLASLTSSAAPPLTHDVSAGALMQGTFWFAGAAWHPEVEVAWRLAPAEGFPWAFSAGLRAATTSRLPLPLEGFARAELIGHVGERSEPMFGLELSLSGIDRPDLTPSGFPAGVSALEAERTLPVCLSVVVAPLRLRFGAFRISALDVHVGATLGAGDVVIFRTGLLRLEYRL